MLAKPLRELPGERWYYNGGMLMLMADFIDQSTLQSFLEYADQALLQPSGIIRYGWTGQWESNKSAPRTGRRSRVSGCAKISIRGVPMVTDSSSDMVADLTYPLNWGRFRGT